MASPYARVRHHPLDNKNKPCPQTTKSAKLFLSTVSIASRYATVQPPGEDFPVTRPVRNPVHTQIGEWRRGEVGRATLSPVESRQTRGENPSPRRPNCISVRWASSSHSPPSPKKIEPEGLPHCGGTVLELSQTIKSAVRTRSGMGQKQLQTGTSILKSNLHVTHNPGKFQTVMINS